MAGGSPEADDRGHGDEPEVGSRDPRRHEPGRVPQREALSGPAEGPPDTTGRRLRQPEVVAVGALCAAATVVFGLYPGPLFDIAREVGDAFNHLL
jgi:NADH-quinone oxidoreductase subunit N